MFNVLISFFISVITTFFLIPKWIQKALAFGLTGKDMNKPQHPEIAEVGGIAIIFGSIIGILFFVGVETFSNEFFTNYSYALIFAPLCTILIIGIIGLMDDMLGWKKGISQLKKPLLVIPATIPMIAINAGQSIMELPIIGVINWGIFYPLLIIPVGIICASNGFNILAGYNGLETTMGIIILTTLGYVGIVTNNLIVVILAFCTVGALLSFLYFNWYPARIFPGDTMTYSVGAIIACIAILGNMEKIAVILFIPYIIDFILVARGKCKMEAFGKVAVDGSISLPYPKVYHLTHFSILILNKIKTKVYEKDIVIFIASIEVGFAFTALLIYGYI